MRILFLSGLYSTPSLPGQGVPNARIISSIRAQADVLVVAPVPWYPRPIGRLLPRIQPLAEVPHEELDGDGFVVTHPRRLHPVGLPALQAALYVGSLLVPLRAEVSRFRPHVLLAAWAYPDGTAAVALGRLLGLPTVVRVMGSDIHDFAHRPRRRSQIRWAMRRAGRVIAVSGPLGRDLEALGVSPNRIRVIPTGVDVRLFRPYDYGESRRRLGLAEGSVILVPARLSREKGIHVFIDALAQLDENVMGVLAGAGPEEARLRARASRLGVLGRLRFLGFQKPETMPRLYSAADAVCLPSLEEGWPNALTESLACGCPIVASAVGGVPDILALTGSGVLAPPGDARGLARSLREALSRRWDRDATARVMLTQSVEATGRRYVDACAEVAAARE
jgi:glycosyltransferase involved in cell wall biosynthesis